MAFTQTDLDRIDRAIATGQLTVEVDGTRITYRGMNELLSARNVIDRQVNAASPDNSGFAVAEFCRD